MEGLEGFQGLCVRALLAAAPCDSEVVEVVVKAWGEEPLSKVGERSRRGGAVVLTAELEKKAGTTVENGEDGRFLRKTGRHDDANPGPAGRGGMGGTSRSWSLRCPGCQEVSGPVVYGAMVEWAR